MKKMQKKSFFIKQLLLFSILKKKVQKEGIIKDYRAKSVYEKPSERKRRKKKEGIANFKKNQKKLKQQRGF